MEQHQSGTCCREVHSWSSTARHLPRSLVVDSRGRERSKITSASVQDRRPAAYRARRKFAVTPERMARGPRDPRFRVVLSQVIGVERRGEAHRASVYVLRSARCIGSTIARSRFGRILASLGPSTRPALQMPINLQLCEQHGATRIADTQATRIM